MLDFTIDPSKKTNKKSLSDETHSFLVHSLGWMEFDESLLTQASSSKAIQRCIVELTSRGDNVAKNFSRQSSSNVLVVKIENSHLKLYDINTNKLLNMQPISNIRVWGINDNNDFAYVARDPPAPMLSPCDELNCPTTPMSPTSSPFPSLKCHVFRCEDEEHQEGVAQLIANALKEEMIRIKEKLQGPNFDPTKSQAARPQHLFIDDYNPSPIATPTIEFPTPIEEPRKTVVAKYLGSCPVTKPTGVNVLNDAIEKLKYEIAISESSDIEEQNLGKPEQLRNTISLVHISPSTIMIESTVNGEKQLECRVRYLSFLGISKDNVKNCGFIIQLSDNRFEAHGFEVEPSSAILCKTIEAACKLRYQKCLDAHKQRCNALLSNEQEPAKTQAASQTATGGSLAAVKNVFSKLWR